MYYDHTERAALLALTISRLTRRGWVVTTQSELSATLTHGGSIIDRIRHRGGYRLSIAAESAGLSSAGEYPLGQHAGWLRAIGK